MTLAVRAKGPRPPRFRARKRHAKPPRAHAGAMSRRPSGPAPARPAPATPSCAVTPGGCEVGDTVRLLGRAHVIDVLHLLVDAGRPLRFGELRDALRVAPNVLSERLRDLAEAGLVRRTERLGATLRVEYEATPMAVELRGPLLALREWAHRHAPPPVPAAPRAGAILA